MEYSLEILEKIQLMRNPFFDSLFIGITVIGEEYFAIAVICLILWCVDKRLGYRIGLAYVASWILNFSLKELFHIPRPFVLDKSIIPLRPETATGFSFPSGHTQSIASLSTVIMSCFRKKWIYTLGAILILIMAWSRLYLGVHTLIDVVGGALVGIVWILAANKIFDYVERTGRKAAFLIVGVPMLSGMVFIQTNDYYKIAGTFTGLLLGYILDSCYIKYEVRGLSWQRLLNFLIGMSVLLFIKFLSKSILGESLSADYMRYFFIGIWITVFAPILFNKIWRKSSEHSERVNTSVDTPG